MGGKMLAYLYTLAKKWWPLRDTPNTREEIEMMACINMVEHLLGVEIAIREGGKIEIDKFLE